MPVAQLAFAERLLVLRGAALLILDLEREPVIDEAGEIGRRGDLHLGRADTGVGAAVVPARRVLELATRGTAV
ncbi:MAG: hypothetical protein NZM42_11510 [Gemmatales bacterium]|nr:hypothetical protein [Gemmatales bacterium]